jgi:hypothetical protein
VNKTLRFAANNVRPDFILLTGDLARHDDYSPIPRTWQEVLDENKEVAQRMSEVGEAFRFGLIFFFELFGRSFLVLLFCRVLATTTAILMILWLLLVQTTRCSRGLLLLGLRFWIRFSANRC